MKELRVNGVDLEKFIPALVDFAKGKFEICKLEYFSLSTDDSVEEEVSISEIGSKLKDIENEERALDVHLIFPGIEFTYVRGELIIQHDEKYSLEMFKKLEGETVTWH